MKLMSPMDSMFLIGETREHPMHVGGLQVFTPPDGAGPEFISETYEAMLACGDIQPTFRKHPAKTLGGFINMAWEFDDEIDIEYHVRRSALPTPGRVRELLELTSRLHGTLLDRHRPLWEAHVIESPRDGRYAVYTKVHHALVDGVSALKLMQRSLSTDPGETEVRVPWALPPRPRQREEAPPKARSRLSRAKDPSARLLRQRCRRFVRTARATVDPAVPGTTHHTERSDRRSAAVRGAVLVAGTHRDGQRRGRSYCQRRCSGHVRRRTAFLPHRSQCPARYAADRDGSGQCAHRERTRRRKRGVNRAVQPGNPPR
jgi:WS/DGAT/MGAT family acyltransferase